MISKVYWWYWCMMLFDDVKCFLIGSFQVNVQCVLPALCDLSVVPVGTKSPDLFSVCLWVTLLTFIALVASTTYFSKVHPASAIWYLRSSEINEDYFKHSSKLLEKYDESWRVRDSECWISECSFPLPLCILCTAVLLKAERCDAVWPVWSMWMWLSFGAIRKKNIETSVSRVLSVTSGVCYPCVHGCGESSPRRCPTSCSCGSKFRAPNGALGVSCRARAQTRVAFVANFFDRIW